MDGTTTRPIGTYDVAREAEALIRCLSGVLHASVHAGLGGIDAIHVTAMDAEDARGMPARIRSALLAGLATPVLPARIHVRTAEAGDPVDTTLGAPTPQPRATPHTGRPLRLLGSPPAEHAHEPIHQRDADPGKVAQEDQRREPTYTGTPHLVAVDLDRPGDGRVLCRVSVAFDAHVHRAEAAAIDLPGAAAHAAAQATVGALVDAGLTGLELGGLREVEIAGRDYVLVALRRTDTCIRHRSGSAPVLDAPERAAARATVAAANDIL